jgi:hypothetical protein
LEKEKEVTPARKAAAIPTNVMLLLPYQVPEDRKNNNVHALTANNGFSFAERHSSISMRMYAPSSLFYSGSCKACAAAAPFHCTNYLSNWDIK